MLKNLNVGQFTHLVCNDVITFKVNSYSGKNAPNCTQTEISTFVNDQIYRDIFGTGKNISKKSNHNIGESKGVPGTRPLPHPWVRIFFIFMQFWGGN